jgi:hypothetical protein
MSSVAQNPPATIQTGVEADASPLFTVRLLAAIGRFVEAQGWLVFVAVSLACGWQRLATVASRPLDHDELYTFYIAQAPTLRQLLDLTHTVDLHPPLSYLLVRASFAVFGVSIWACRLPSVLAFLFTTALVFFLMKRILSSVYGIISVLLLWSVPFTYQADEARPYSLLLFFSTLMLVGWYRSTEGVDSSSLSRRLALLTLTLSGFGLLLSHVLGVFSYGAFFAAEFTRFFIRRKPDWKLWAALLIPVISGLTYLPLIRNRSAIEFTDEYHVTPLRVFDCYWWSIRFLAIPLTLIAILVCFGGKRQSQATRDYSAPLFPRASTATQSALWTLLGCISLIPIGIALLFARTGTAFFYRYGIVVSLPIVLVPTLLLGVRTERRTTVAVSLALVLGIVFLFNTSGRFWLIEQLASFAPPKVSRYVLGAFELPTLVLDRVKSRVPAYLQLDLASAPAVADLDALEPELPLVANTGLTFLEVDREGGAALTRRLYLLNDRQAAAAIAHDTVFENYDRLTKVFPIRGKVESFCTFIGEHPHFLILGAYNHPQGWLLKRLELEGVRLKIVGTYARTYEEHDIYEVSLPANPCAAIR